MRVALEEREETDTEIDWQSLRTLFTDVSDAWEAVKKQGPLYVTQTVEIVYPPGASPQANSSTRSSREPPGRPSQEGSSGYSQLDKAAVLAKLFESGMISPSLQAETLNIAGPSGLARSGSSLARSHTGTSIVSQEGKGILVLFKGSSKAPTTIKQEHVIEPSNTAESSIDTAIADVVESKTDDEAADNAAADNAAAGEAPIADGLELKTKNEAVDNADEAADNADEAAEIADTAADSASEAADNAAQGHGPTDLVDQYGTALAINEVHSIVSADKDEGSLNSVGSREDQE
ncbi:MAG: hypothetical protein TREMPRED_001330 [Tremellales sp. Tagirdzhanova-0007]|nr:MAG: hypothetical protein TREMPRED_001330 [Tremellales sp. Tagirdzhanova-0007]